jgi:hypothetical protein
MNLMCPRLQVRLSSKELHMMIRDTMASAGRRRSSGVSGGIISAEVGGINQETFFELMGCSSWY